MIFTLACVLVKGKGRKYTPDYVARLRRMVAKHTDQPFRTICLTDQPDAMPEGVEAVEIPNPYPYRGWWAKMHLFDPLMPFEDRILYLDLDIIVLKDLAAFLDFPAEFAIAPDSAPNFLGKGRMKAIKAYNSSVMVWDHGVRSRLFTEFDPWCRRRLWSDQDAIAEMSPGEKTFPLEWFTRIGPGSFPFPLEKKIGLCTLIKNHVAVQQFGWFEEFWN